MRGIIASLNLNQKTPAEVNLFGTIRDEKGDPLPGVSVSMNGLETSTDSSGRYNFRDIEAGKYQITFTKEGYWNEVRTKTLVSSLNFLSFSMTPITEPEPGKVPWVALGVALLGIVGVGLLVAQTRHA